MEAWKKAPEGCPFCGSVKVETIWAARGLAGPLEFFCACMDCGARGPKASDPLDAVLGWNGERT